MKRLRILFMPALAALVFSGCALLRSTPETPDIVGNWSYVVKNTPQGDAPGVISIAYAGEVFSGKMTVDMLMQTVEIEDASWEEPVFTFAAVLDINGQDVRTTTTLTVAEDTAAGSIDVPGYGTFDVTATRQPSEQ